VLFLLVKKLSGRQVGLIAAVFGVVFVTRPLLIDFEYGQVNLFILGACVWALLGHDEEQNCGPAFFQWMTLAFVAVTKIFPLPLLLVPFLVTSGFSRKKLYSERAGIVVGCAIATFLPLFTVGWSGMMRLIKSWGEALLARGLPMESHNQSFTALLYHYLSGNPTQILSEGAQPLVLGSPFLSAETITLVSLFWTLASMGFTLGWIVTSRSHPRMKWIAVLIGLLIIPSHLVWKPYFVMSLPLAVLLFQQVFKRTQVSTILITLALFGGINLTGFDFIGHHWAAHFEAASILLVMHVLLMGFVLKKSAV
jgi:hypothetical protein